MNNAFGRQVSHPRQIADLRSDRATFDSNCWGKVVMLDVKACKLELRRIQLPDLVTDDDIPVDIAAWMSIPVVKDLRQRRCRLAALGCCIELQVARLEFSSCVTRDIASLGTLEEVVTLVAKESVVEASRFRVDDWVMRVIFKINQAEAVAWSVKSFMQVKGHKASVVILRMEKLLLYALCVRHFAKTTFLVNFILNPASSRAMGRVFGSEPDFTLKILLADALL